MDQTVFRKKRLNSNVDSFFPSGKKPQKKKKTQKPESETIKIDYEYKFDFLRLDSYSSEEKIKKKFQSLSNFNNPKIDLKNYKNSDYYLILAENYDDIHKAIKYGIWHSPLNSQKLNEVYIKNKNLNKKTILFFRVKKDSKICGVAEMNSEFISEPFELWWEKKNSEGIFFIKWIFVKNLDLECFSRMEKEKSFLELEDGTNISFENGFYLLEIIKNIVFLQKESIFRFFKLFDQREDGLYAVRVKVDFEIKLQKKQKAIGFGNKNGRNKNKRKSFSKFYSGNNNKDYYKRNSNLTRRKSSKVSFDNSYYIKKIDKEDDELNYVKK